jgi:hypothetical protein
VSVFTKQVSTFRSNASVYIGIFVVWIFFSLLLTGLVRHAAGEGLSLHEVLFLFAVAAMTFWCAYYAWLNGYLWLTRNKAGQKRDMLESEADLKYRPR